MKRSLLFGTLTAASCLAATLAPCATAHAQQQAGGSGNAAPPPASSTAATPTSVSLDVRDAPLRQVLIQLFQKAELQYSIDPAVQGFVTLKVTDQPFETVLKLVLRSASAPLTYTVTSGVYEIKPRTLLPTPPAAPTPAAPPSGEPVLSGDDGHHLAVIPLTYLDPYDVQQLLGVVLVPSGTRGGANGGAGGAGQPSGGTNRGGQGTGLPGGSGMGTLGANGTGSRIISGGGGSFGSRPGR